VNQSGRASLYVIDVVEAFLRTKLAREPKTHQAYSSVLLGSTRGTKKPLGQPFAVYFHNRKFGSLTHDEVTTWFAQRVKGGGQTTKHRISKQAREFLTWSFEHGHSKSPLQSALQPFRPGQGRQDYLTWPEVHALLDALPERRYRFAAAWLFFTGCRVGEAIRATHADVRWHEDAQMFAWSIAATTSKTHTARTVWLPDELAEMLRLTLELNKPHPSWPILWDSEGRGFGRIENPAAPITDKVINAALERARATTGLTIKVTAHVAKHTYCTNWVKQQGKSELAIEKLSRQVGTSVAVLRNTYVHHTLDADDFAEIRAFGSSSTSYGG
jgi:integrase